MRGGCILTLSLLKDADFVRQKRGTHAYCHCVLECPELLAIRNTYQDTSFFDSLLKHYPDIDNFIFIIVLLMPHKARSVTQHAGE